MTVEVNHGTRTMGSRGCQCDECQAIRRGVNSGHDRETGKLLTQCWCRRDNVLVTAADVGAGITKTCGRKWCKP